MSSGSGLMRNRRSGEHPRIPGRVCDVARGNFLVDETVERDVGPPFAAILADLAVVAVQKAVQHA